MSSASARLCRKLDLVLEEYWMPGRMLLEHPRARQLYPAYLATSSYVTLEMAPLMEAALDRARVLAPEDPVAARLVGYLERHIPEEMHGDEPGGELLDDLAAVGVDCQALRAGPLPESMAALIGTQFFRIRHAHPAAVLGFLWLEVYPPSTAFVEQLIERTGLPGEGFRLLQLHSEVDPRHGTELQDFVDTLPLQSWQEELIGLSALQTMGFLVDAWLAVLAGDGHTPAAVAPGRTAAGLAG
jgi:hypothetical protein